MPYYPPTSGGGDVSKVGTPANNEMAVWTGDGTLEGTSDFTYDGTSLNLITAKNFQIAGSTILADSAGTTTLSGIDALDATTEGTIESAIDTLANLTAIQGWVVTLTGNFIRSGAHSLTLTTTGATDVTLPTTGTLATLAGAETLSSKTLTAPKFADGGFIADSNGNELLKFELNASAVNEVSLENAATTVAPRLSATGGDTNIDLDLRGKGTGSILQTIRYQTDDSDVIANATQTAVRFCIGWGQLTGDGDAGMSGTVAFDPDFTTVLWAAAGPIARSSSATAAATAITDLTVGFGAGAAPSVSYSNLATTGFTVSYTRDAASTFTSGSEYGFWWMAAGIGSA